MDMGLSGFVEKLGYMTCSVSISGSGSTWNWNPGTLEPAVGLQSRENDE